MVRTSFSHPHAYWRLVIFLVAVLLRMTSLLDVPPGLTHDEADHGLSAWEVVEGARPLYFTVGYGREPLFDYVTAGLMAITGPTVLAGRLTAVYMSLLLLAVTYALVRRLFNDRVALWTMAGMATGFWPVMVGRQILRSIAMPTLLTAAMALWWPGRRQTTIRRRITIAAGVLLGLSFYTYIPARVMWLLLPSMLSVWAIADRRRLGEMWRSTLVVLLIALVVGTPLFIYLGNNPSAEVRIGQLSTPLGDALGGNWGPLGTNVMEGVRLIPFRGDPAWRYNIALRPLLVQLMASFFGFGLLLAFWEGLRRNAVDRGPYLLIIGWLLLGLAPVFITGAHLANTQAVAMMPVLYVFPALFLERIWRSTGDRPQSGEIPSYQLYGATAIVCLFAYVALDTAQAYFVDWATHPEVRVQYESALVASIDYINDSEVRTTGFSTTTPGRFHSQAVGLLTLDPTIEARWFHGQHSLVLPPSDRVTLVFSGFAPPAPELEPLLTALDIGQTDTVPLMPDDLDQPVIVYEFDGALAQTRLSRLITSTSPRAEGLYRNEPAIDFRGVLSFPETIVAHDQLVVQSVWAPQRRMVADVVLFTQLLGPEGVPVAQADRLDVPASAWHKGDLFVQQHMLTLPEDLPAGRYTLIAGAYVSPSLQRFDFLVEDPNRGVNDRDRDFIPLTTIDVQ